MLNATQKGLPARQFWTFSITFYEKPGVQAQMLRWQDENHANVNLALLCIWAGSVGRKLGASDIRRAVSAVSGWNTAVTRPLRQLRRRLKAEWQPLAIDSEPTRQAVLSAELEAEKAEQALLLKALAPWSIAAGPDAAALPDAPALIEANLAAYLGSSATAEPAFNIAAICSGE